MSQASELEQYLLELVNAERAARGAQPLAFDGRLNEAAEGHSDWMLETDIFSHTGVGGSDGGDRIQAAGYELTGAWRWGENIAWASLRPPEGTQDEIDLIHRNLMNSAGHRQNILQEDFREIGIGIVFGRFEDYDAVTVTENFGRSGQEVYLTGVAFDDLDGDGAYDPGEGLGDVAVAAESDRGQTSTTSTKDAGGYRLALEPGSYTVEISSEGLETLVRRVRIGEENVKLDYADPRPASDPPPLPPEPSAIVGTAADDRLFGTTEDDTIRALEGDDRLVGYQGEDWLEGDAGEDDLFGEGQADVVHGGDGADRIFGGTGADNLFGEAGADRLKGQSGDDTLRGGDDDDTLFGDSGNDLLRGNGGDDLIFGGADDDLLQGGGGADRLSGNKGDDRLEGNNGDDTLLGHDGDDRLEGGEGEDRLFGFEGADVLAGGADDDRLVGGLGPDRFVFEDGTGSDVVADFVQGEDLVDLTATGIGGLGELSISGNANKTVIFEAALGKVTLYGVGVEDIQAGDFLFAG